MASSWPSCGDALTASGMQVWNLKLQLEYDQGIWGLSTEDVQLDKITKVWE